MTGAERRRRLAEARLYLIVTVGVGSAEAGDPLKLAPVQSAPVQSALSSGAIDLVQLRDLTGDVAARRARAEALHALCRQYGALFLLNDEPETAASLDLDGAHVGVRDAPPALARASLGDERLLGLSTHDPTEVAAARALPVDYLGLGPCYPTKSKRLAYTPGGADLLRRCLPAAGNLPVFPIGGITPENLPALVAAGARRAAVGAGILTASDPAEAARRMQGALATE